MNDQDPTPAMRKLRSLAELPCEMAPQRDLWPGIAAEIGTARDAAGSPVRGPAPARTPRFALGIAASVAILALGVWLGRNMLPGGQGASGQLSAATPGLTASAAPATGHSATEINGAMPMAASFALDTASSNERQRRLAALAGQLAALPLETQAKVKASLGTIEKSVLEIQTALGRDPGNLLLQEMLVNSYQEEMRVLGAVDDANREII